MKVLYDMTYTQGAKFYSGLYEYGKKNLENKIKDVDVLQLKKYNVDPYIKNNCNIVYVNGDKDTNELLNEIYKLSFNYDIIYFPYQLTTRKIKLAPSCKLIFTIHDLAQFDLAKINKTNKFEKYYLTNMKSKLKYMTKQILRISHIWHHKLHKVLQYNIDHAYKIIAITNATKDDIVKRFRVDVNKINICYSPIKFLDTKESKLNLTNYFLFVSASRYTKNVINAIKAFDLYKEKTGSNIKFVITGNLLDSILNISKYKEDIINMSYLDSNDLEYLYKNASCLIFSSFYEGFGMPPLEAMKYGTKVICSNLPCLKELYHHALFFNPFSAKDICDKLLSLDKIKKEDMLKDYDDLYHKCTDALMTHKDIILK